MKGFAIGLACFLTICIMFYSSTLGFLVAITFLVETAGRSIHPSEAGILGGLVACALINLCMQLMANNKC